jgi:hypothetical protein
VILLDANLLIYAHVTSSVRHDAAREWLDTQFAAGTPVALPWPSLLSFVRLVSNPRVFERPEPVADAWNQVTEWLACAGAWIPEPGERHAEILGELMRSSVTQANLVPDAHLAALAMEHGLLLCSTDGDFARFPGLRWTNPLA